MCFFQLNPPLAEEIHLRRMKSLRDEIPLRGNKDAADLIISEAVHRRLGGLKFGDFYHLSDNLYKKHLLIYYDMQVSFV